jgi:hypothetical protein
MGQFVIKIRKDQPGGKMAAVRTAMKAGARRPEKSSACPASGRLVSSAGVAFKLLRSAC